MLGLGWFIRTTALLYCNHALLSHLFTYIGSTLGIDLTMNFWLSCFVTYVLSSQLVLYFPWLIHDIGPAESNRESYQYAHSEFWDRAFSDVVMQGAHRGGAGERPENTMAAFRHADKLGMTMLELDVHLSEDHQVVVVHDRHTHRLSKETSLLSLPLMFNPEELKLPPPFHFPGTYLDFQHTDESKKDIHSHSRFPLLEQVFQEFPHLAVNIDIKNSNEDFPRLAELVSDLIHKFKREDRTFWGSFSASVTQLLNNYDPTIPSFFSLRSMMYVYVTYWFGLIGFVPISVWSPIFGTSSQQHIIEIPLFSQHFLNNLMHAHGERNNYPDWEKPGHCAWHFRWFVYLIQFFTTRPSFFRHLQMRGYRIVVWVLNDESEFEMALKLGVDGIMTDFPTKLKNFVEKQRQQMK